jgi:hypothetical protein
LFSGAACGPRLIGWPPILHSEFRIDEVMPTATKRRWFQFSLRTLFVVVTAWALVLPLIPPIVARYRAWRSGWDEVGGLGIITPPPPITCYMQRDADDESADDDDASEEATNESGPSTIAPNRLKTSR